MISPYVFAGLTEVMTQNKTVKGAYQFKDVIECVAEVFRLTTMDIVKKTRKREIVEARHIAIYILRHDCEIQLKRVAAMFRQDHTTVIYAVTTAENLMGNTPEYKQKYEEAVQLLKHRHSYPFHKLTV